ncbi:hypothetical protein Rsub_08352 [Raphidocelis subcapitata]|uniref:BTB domain-containing protein n=1 Tax=Raphidocelis subcapitata TaxID=307507 RepID=A0A2V0PBY4_9CHLO|nr:hypothetical protein Rsub_08352 [Raphidocelis subcapitata]|eukprot:GBF95390.1 hypothetical protein Rsub_08352 [Raphidocelis subcapitata]
MEVRPTILALDELADAVRQHEAPPEELSLDFPFRSPLGACYIDIDAMEPVDGGDDHWLACYLCWSGHPEYAPVDVRYAFELAAVKESGAGELLGYFFDSVEHEWTLGQGLGAAEVCKWSELRRAVLGGCSLQMAGIVLPSSGAAATLDTALLIPSSRDSALTAIGPMLCGPFTDVAVTAGGRTFRAHRVMLAAASPVFLSMLDGAMREAREAVVELVDADAGVVELLLRHVYGCAIEVTVSLALQLHALADQYQLAAGLQQRLRLGLMALRLAPEALVKLVPAARTLCRSVFDGSLCQQAKDALPQLSPLPAFAGWPVDAVVEVMEDAGPLTAFGAAVAWMEAQPQPAKRRHVWPQLLDAVGWAEASSSELRAIRQHASAARVPGLEGRLLDAYDDLCTRLEQQPAIDIEEPVDGGDDRWMGGFLHWSGDDEDAPADVPFAFELAAVKEGGARQLLGCFGTSVSDAWKKGQGQGTADLCKWSELRGAVLGGCSLQMAVVVLPPSSAAATSDTALHVSDSRDSALTAIGPMLDGPFTDMAVTAGGRTFRTHRVVLAAASPVFLSMLDGAMREAREAVVELVDADAGVVELLLRHVYGCAIEVPVSLALQLYALADQYQLAGGLQQRLRLWLAALRLAPEALVELVPAARTLCPAAWDGGLCQQAASVLSQLSPLPAFAGWPVDSVVEVMEDAVPLTAFNAAAAWMEAQPRPAKRRNVWPRLLNAVPWARASGSDLRAIRQHASAGRVPGLEGRVSEAALRLCEGLEEFKSEATAKVQELQEHLQQQEQQQGRAAAGRRRA